MQNIGFIYISILLLSFLFFIFSQLTLQFSISIIIIILLSYYVGKYYQNQIDEQDKTNQESSKAIDKDIGDRKEIFSKIVSLSVPKELKFLKKSNELVKILTNVNFIKKFDKTRYSDILLNTNQLMKIYIYILSERYEIINGMTMFIDVRDNIIELLYSIIMVVPQNVKHSYGFEPYVEIEKTTEDFINTSRKMLEILEKFATIKQKNHYIPDTKYKPYNSVKDTMFP